MLQYMGGVHSVLSFYIHLVMHVQSQVAALGQWVRQNLKTNKQHTHKFKAVTSFSGPQQEKAFRQEWKHVDWIQGCVRQMHCTVLRSLSLCCFLIMHCKGPSQKFTKSQNANTVLIRLDHLPTPPVRMVRTWEIIVPTLVMHTEVIPMHIIKCKMTNMEL